MNVKNELTNAVWLASSYDVNGNLTNRVYDARGPKTYVYHYDDENQLIEMRTDTSATPTGSRWRTTWAYDGVGRARVRTVEKGRSKKAEWRSAWPSKGS